jgi:serine/threonine protein kinase
MASNSSFRFKRGELSALNTTYKKQPFFRKYVNETEYEIAKILMKYPHPNIVKIYRIKGNKEKYIDMEIVSNEPPTKQEILDNLENLKSAKEHMHSHGIVYIDWKPDNMGKDVHGNIKIFDFDSSGFFTRNYLSFIVWKDNQLPSFSYVLVAAMNAKKRSPIKIDDWIFDNMLHPEVIEKYGPDFSHLNFNVNS